jgi:hypothetical protein
MLVPNPARPPDARVSLVAAWTTEDQQAKGERTTSARRRPAPFEPPKTLSEAQSRPMIRSAC